MQPVEPVMALVPLGTLVPMGQALFARLPVGGRCEQGKDMRNEGPPRGLPMER